MRDKHIHNSSKSLLENQFAKYLVTSIHNKKTDILRKRATMRRHEMTAGNAEETAQWASNEQSYELELVESANDMLDEALKELTARERYVLFGRVLRGQSFEELAEVLGLTYKGVAAVYYRATKKVRKRLEKDKNGF